MTRKSFSLIHVFCTLVLLFAGQSIASAAASVEAYVYVGTVTAPKALYIETAAKGNSDVDINASMYITNGNWFFQSVWFDAFTVTKVNGITTTTATIEGYVNDDTLALVTYTWTSLRSVNTLKIKMVDYYSGALIGGVDTTKIPYTSQTGFFNVK